MPFSRSSPIERSRTSGFEMPRISSAKTAPIVANWSRCSGRASAFAPASIRTDGPRLLGIGTRDRRPHHAGDPPQLDQPGGEHCAGVPRGDDGVRRTRRRRREPRRRGSCPASSGRPRPASRPSRSRPPPRGARALPSRARAGRRAPERSSSLAASRAPATISAGPRSPPIASTAIRITALRGVDAERLDVAATVRAAGRAEVMRALGIPARPANVHLGGADRMRRPTLVAARFRCFSLGDGHERWPV